MTNNFSKKVFDKLTQEKREQFNREVLEATYKAQKKYGFNESSTWNNKSDAFKHAYLSWYLSYYYGQNVAKWLGNMHEDETPNAHFGERNMDLWNNQIGRELTEEIREYYSTKVKKMSKEEISDFVSYLIKEKIENGELITTPSDKRRYSNMQYDRLKDSDRVFYKGELYEGMDEKERRRFSDRYFQQQNWKQMNMPSKEQLEERVSKGELIKVRNYVRGDGVSVNGYYRHRPVH